MADAPLPYLESPADARDYTDAAANSKLEAAAAMKAARMREVEAAILNTPDGREWLWGLLAGLHVHEPRMAVTGSAFENGFWMGEYSAGNRILRRLASSDPVNFARMFHEQDQG